MKGEARGVPGPYAPRAGRRELLPAHFPCLPYSVSWKCELAMAPGPVASGCGPAPGLGFESSAFRSPLPASRRCRMTAGRERSSLLVSSVPRPGVPMPGEGWLTLSPVPLNLDGKDRDLVGLGSYIVNAQAACNDCHTNPPFVPGGDPFKGEPEQVNSAHFLAGGVSFGPIVSPNITPDASGRPAGADFEEFERYMRTGREEDGGILQLMPWPIYRNMSDRELRAIYEYLRAIPHAEPGP